MDKEHHTHEILNNWSDHRWQFDQALVSWWSNLRQSGGLRLSAVGYDIFLEHSPTKPIEFVMDVDLLTPRNLITLDRKMTCPYAIVRTKSPRAKLIMFGSKEAVMATLYGDIEMWIQSLSR